MIPATVSYPDIFTKVIFWNYYDQIGEGQPVAVYAWPRFSFQFTGDNVGDCELDIYGTHEGLEGICWGLIATLKMPIHDRMHDTFLDSLTIPICSAYKPIVRGRPDIGNHLGVFCFCTKFWHQVGPNVLWDH